MTHILKLKWTLLAKKKFKIKVEFDPSTNY